MVDRDLHVSYLVDMRGVIIPAVLMLGIIMLGCSDPVIRSGDYTDCKIYRDRWGVPHIHGKTDADVAYGLAWASAEDDFITLQEQMIAIRGRLGEVKGKDGVIADIGIKYMGLTTYVNEHLHEIETATLALMQGYVDGVNAYAALHADELLLDDLFPLRIADLAAGNLLGLSEISGAGSDLKKILEGRFSSAIIEEEKGSNAIAFSRRITEERQTFLAINSHQPMEGWYSWYEVHLISDEGLNILGGTFPGGTTIFHGTNEHLGWAHTVNHADFSDVYLLEMHPEKPDHYLLDGEWLQLEEIDLTAKVSLLGPLKWPISRKMYKSQYGLTFEVEGKYYAWRFQARESMRSMEQWYKMNKARSFEEWIAALDIQGIPCTNIVYADKEDNIYFISNGRHHKKDQSTDWDGLIKATSSTAFWSDQIWPISTVPQVENPPSGYVYNVNNTPYASTDSLDNPQISSAQATMYYQPPHAQNNRSLRFQELIDDRSTWSYEDFKTLKYDRQYPSRLKAYPYDEEPLLQQDPSNEEDLHEAIALLQSWNRSTSADNDVAPLFLLAKEELRQIYIEQEEIHPGDYKTAISRAVDIIQGKFHRLKVPLGEFQRHRRGDVDLPMAGGSDVLAAIYSAPEDDGKYRAYSGESYIQLVRFDSIQGPIIETVNAFGSSAESDSPHYADQMEMFAAQNLKPMTLDLEKVIAEAATSYHPQQLLD